MLSLRTKALLLNAGVVGACVVQLRRGYPLWLILICGGIFLIVGNFMVYLAARQERRARGELSRFAFKDDRDTWKELKR